MLFCDFFELLEVEVTVEEALLCSGLEFPFDSSPGDEDGGVGGRLKSEENCTLMNQFSR